MVTDECQLEDTLGRQHIGAIVFLPFVIARLQRGTPTNEAILTVNLRNITDEIDTNRILRIRWDAANVPVQPLAVQEKVITEWAACGVACAVVAVYTGLQVMDVADEGDRFDYWIGGSGPDYGLEVSGTLTEAQSEVEARHRAKVRQLRSNPHEVNGFVAVADFSRREVILSFHRFAEELPQ